METVLWMTDLRAALRRARQENRPLLLVVVRRGDAGSAQLDAESFAHLEAVRRLNGQWVPVRLDAAASPEAVQIYDIAWTPALLALDHRGKPQYRFEGYLPPDELPALLDLARAALAFRGRRYAAARDRYAALLAEHPATRFRPEALYYLGAAGMAAGDRDGGAAAWAALQREAPDSLWALRIPTPAVRRAAA